MSVFKNLLLRWQVMVKGEGLRVVKHNRSGGSQVRIIRYDPEIKALVWNSKRYMKKGNVPWCCPAPLVNECLRKKKMQLVWWNVLKC